MFLFCKSTLQTLLESDYWNLEERMRNLLVGLFNFVLIIIVFGSYVIVAQSVVTGEWTAETNREKPDKIHLSFEGRTEKGERNQNGSSYDLADLQV